MRKLKIFVAVLSLATLFSCSTDEVQQMPDMSGKKPLTIIQPRTESEKTARYDTDFQCVEELDCAGFAVQEDIENPDTLREMQCHVTWKSRNQIGQWYGTVSCDSGREYFFIYWNGSVALYP